MVGSGQFVDKLVEVAVHHGVQPVDRLVDAVVGHPILREVIGADLLAAVTGADLLAPHRALGVRALLLLHVIEPRAQNTHGLEPVLELALFVLA